jgi:hypothetical protein
MIIIVLSYDRNCSYSCRLLEPCDFSITFFSAAASAHRGLLIRQHAPVCTAICPLFVSESLQSVGQMHRAINVAAAAAAQSAKSNASDKHREEHGTRDQKVNLRSSCCALARTQGDGSNAYVKCAQRGQCAWVPLWQLGGSVLYMSGE